MIGLGLTLNKVQSQNIGPLNLVNSSFFTYYSAPITVAPPSQPVSLEIGDGNYEIYSNGSVTMLPGFMAKTIPASNGFYVADLGIHLPEPELFGLDLDNVVRYEKMEMGISLPSLETRIHEFLDDMTGQYKVASTGYNTAFGNGTIVNPYDPEHISVEAHFYHGASTVPIVRNGFFYKEYIRMDVSGPEYYTHDWVAVQTGNGIDEYEWRIRFSPPETGSWKCMILVTVGGELLPEHYFFKFNVVPGTKPGFVEISDNHQYLQFSGPTHPQFFPVGNNASWQIHQPIDGGYCNSQNCENPFDHRIFPDSYLEIEDYLDKLTYESNGGVGAGNHTRVIFAPWSYEVEFEKLGNYQTRQIEMFELDEHLRAAAAKDVYLSISPLNGLVLTDEWESTWGVNVEGNACCLGEYSDTWAWNPYCNNHTPDFIYSYDPTMDPNSQFKGLENVMTPLDFFTNANAKKWFKNKLRYMDARWGYSPNYYQLEISTEIDKFDTEFWHWPSNNYDIQNWVNEMADYVKNDLKITQLTTVNYGQTPAPLNTYDPPSLSYSTIWNGSDIDLVTLHEYSDVLGNGHVKSDLINNALGSFDKPCLINENDVWRYGPVDKCTPISMHNLLWSSAFSGSYGTGMQWEFRSPFDLADEYKAMRTLFSYIDLTISNGYTPYHTTADLYDYQPIENFFLIKSGGPGNFSNKAYGWIHNRSYNEYTYGDCNQPVYHSHYVVGPNPPNLVLVTETLTTMQQIMDFFDFESAFQLHKNEDLYSSYFPTDYQAYPQTASRFALSGLIPNATYTIEYFYTSGPPGIMGTFDPAFNFTFTTYDIGGQGVYNIINGPPTGGGLNPLTGQPYPPDWAYLVHLSNEPRSYIADQNWKPMKDSLIQNRVELSNQGSNTLDLSVSPNPNDGSFTISAKTDKRGAYRFVLTDISGSVIQSQIVELIEGVNRISFSNTTLAPGVYLMKVEGYTEVLKIVIN